MKTFITNFLSSSLFRFLVIGGLSFLLDLGLLTLCFQVFGWPLWLATGAGFWGSFFFNYFLQRYFAFGGGGTALGGVLRYSGLLAFNTVAVMGIVQLFQFMGLGFVAGKVVATIVTMGWNYFIYKHWIFPQKKQPKSAHEQSDGASGTGSPASKLTPNSSEG
ncbi:GtrA family protein [Arthrobacter sp. fls2-241-R2A-200]|uniref:GtrA family protein n=1 Tax=unclassified Arthrobacter TaxID=235627 RepID=UPI00254B4F19|nr:GtrA family protein [Arthrobacter sp. fls2-241-R2A-200]